MQFAEALRRAWGGARVPAGRGVHVALAVVVLVGGALRLTGVDWDRGAHLHPDERYVTMVADAVGWPASPAEYFDVEGSPLSPYATDTGRNYLYGQLPLFATKAVAAAAGRDHYDGVHLVGRVLSALVDTLSILLVFLVGRQVLAGRGRRVRDLGSLVAAALYALAVTAIQHAHFFTMESWLVCTTLLTFALAGRAASAVTGRTPIGRFALVGAALGLTAATKVSGLLVALPVAVAIAAAAWRRPAARVTERLAAAAAAALVVVASGYVAFRLVSPYAFAHSSWFRVEPNHDFRAALEAQRGALGGEALYPPAYQWLLSTPWLDPLRNLVLWSVGLPLGLAALCGLAVAAVAAARELNGRSLRPGVVSPVMLLTFVAATFAYYASLFAHSIRYLITIVPFLCVAAAVGLVALHERRPLAGRVAAAAVVGVTLLYALAFTSIYRAPNTRVAAASWLERAAAPGSRVVQEHWDDGLPYRSPPEGLTQSELTVFDPDDDAKLRKLYEGLAGADYYVLSSPRAWRTIGRLPGRFPLMTSFYARLRRGELGFREAARFESPPRLLGAAISDLGAEESFWVYDHPPVRIFTPTRELAWPAFRDGVCRGLGRVPGCP